MLPTLGLEKVVKEVARPNLVPLALSGVKSEHLISRVPCSLILVIIHKDTWLLSLFPFLSSASVSVTVERWEHCCLLWSLHSGAISSAQNLGSVIPSAILFSDHLASVFCSNKLSQLHQSCVDVILWKAWEIYKSDQKDTISLAKKVIDQGKNNADISTISWIFQVHAGPLWTSTFHTEQNWRSQNAYSLRPNHAHFGDTLLHSWGPLDGITDSLTATCLFGVHS